jgi:hypothetical protein
MLKALVLFVGALFGISSGDVRDKADNPLVFVILLTLIVFALGNVGKAVGGHFNWQGIYQFFGGK